VTDKQLLIACLEECGDDVEAAFSAAEYILATYPEETSIDKPGDGIPVDQAMSLEEEEEEEEEETGAASSGALDTAKEPKATTRVEKRRNLFRKLRVRRRWRPRKPILSTMVARVPRQEPAVRATSVPLALDGPARVHVASDFDRLRAVVVGRLDNDVLPVWYPNFEGLDGNEVLGPPGMTKREYNPAMFERAIEQTEGLCRILEREGVFVYRPELLDSGREEPVGLSAEWPREVFTVYGDRAVVNQPRAPHRRKDWAGCVSVFQGAELLRPPKCDASRDNDLVNDPRLFIEGGDVFRLGHDVLITVSYMATSPAGFRWLVDSLPDFEFWPAYLTEDWEHGDYVFMPVRPGLCVAYVEGFKDGLLPSPVTDWDVVRLTREEADDKFAANGIVLRENTVILPAGNSRVVRALEKRGVDVLEVPFDGPCYWQGGIDCATNEVWRE
jgi:glycine amidinotransferase